VGVLTLFREQHNAWIHALATLLVVAVGLYFGLSRLEWCALILAVMAVWCAEALNTALELLADASVPERHPLVAKAKDVAAGAVLLTAVGAAIVGAVVLWPYLRAWSPTP
jgi:diacylglycerol kinase (ATP)